jgi:cyclopropane fatty-acyl-phospholipid synthase-like methyltransferase
MLPDFGTYHHSTPRSSEKVREKIRILFTKVFGSLPFAQDNKLKILDVGCGLGFLSCVCAEYYPNAKVTGFDTFEHASLKDSSLAKAKNNAKILGFKERIKFQNGDVFLSDYRKSKFDFFVSNLVFHNLGKKRFDAYERLSHWMTPKSFVVLGDVFFDYKTDLRWLASLFGNVEKKPILSIGSGYKVVVLSEPKK